MTDMPKIPPAEMEMLRYVMDHHPISVRGVAEYMAETKGYTRTTVLNLMERLRKRGYLDRKKREGVFRYSPTTPRVDVMRMQVRNFIRESLGGSLEPFMVYLTAEESVDDEQLAELKRIVAELDNRRGLHLKTETEEP